MERYRTLEMTIITHNNKVFIAYSGTAPDWALEAIHKAEQAEDGYSRLEATHAEYLKGDSLEDWDTERGERTKERPAPKVDPVQELQSRESQILAELSRIDQASVRPMRAGEKDKLDELEALAVEKRKELSEVRKELPQTDTEGSTPWITKQLN